MEKENLFMLAECPRQAAVAGELTCEEARQVLEPYQPTGWSIFVRATLHKVFHFCQIRKLKYTEQY